MSLIDTYYERGQLPDRYYNQLNKRHPQENYSKFKLSKKKSNEGLIISMIKGMLSATLKTALDELF